MTAIEFMRTKVAFESFVTSYGSIQFPLPGLNLE